MQLDAAGANTGGVGVHTMRVSSGNGDPITA